MCLAQGHNAVTPARLEPAASRSRGKHSTTEPLRSQLTVGRGWGRGGGGAGIKQIYFQDK